MKPTAIIRSRLLIYGGINAIAAFATFLTVPVLVRLLGIENFGVWSLVEPVIFFGTALALLGSEHGAMKQIAYEGQEAGRVVGEIAATGMGVMLVSAVVVYAAARTIVGTGPALVIAALAVVEGLLALLMTAARAARATVPFAVGQIGRSLVFCMALVGVLLLGVRGTWNVGEVLVLRLVLTAVILAALLAVMRPRPGLAPGRLGDAARYGSFILLTSFLTMGLDMTDRYFVGWWYGADAVGSYMVHVKLASVVGQGIVVPFSLWFAPERLRRIGDADGGEQFFDRAALALTAVCCLFAGATFLTGPYLVGLMAPGVTFDGVTLMATLVAASAIGLTYALNIGLLKPGYTHLNVLPILAGLAAGLPLSALLVGPLGPDGAALGRLAGTLVFLVAVARLSNRVHPLAFSYMTILAMAVASVLLALGISRALPDVGLLGTVQRLAAFGVALACAAGSVALLRGRRMRLASTGERLREEI